MAKYLFQGNYVGDGIKGLLKKGGSDRVAAVKEALASIGGNLECFYFAFGEYDYFIIADLPDQVTAAAVSLAVSASGLLKPRTVVLITPEQMDEAANKSYAFRPPGQ